MLQSYLAKFWWSTQGTIHWAVVLLSSYKAAGVKVRRPQFRVTEASQEVYSDNSDQINWFTSWSITHKNTRSKKFQVTADASPRDHEIGKKMGYKSMRMREQ